MPEGGAAPPRNGGCPDCPRPLSTATGLLRRNTALGQLREGPLAAVSLVPIRIICIPLGRASFGALSGLVALIAILRRRERAISVFLAVVPLAFVVLFVVLELTGHA
jgi:hypothetical protein